eukprot:TRINITY_DN4306_c1_g1_i1.p1 TRINITY_DN4306_c1_g1~~TRINITY_DN4306_c1_g1_i1.p1  ORF type:complete len:274 (+),score=-6.49 TRINITY_DN4306_c1_g1_i1:89-823(+)
MSPNTYISQHIPNQQFHIYSSIIYYTKQKINKDNSQSTAKPAQMFYCKTLILKNKYYNIYFSIYINTEKKINECKQYTIILLAFFGYQWYKNAELSSKVKFFDFITSFLIQRSNIMKKQLKLLLQLYTTTAIQSSTYNSKIFHKKNMFKMLSNSCEKTKKYYEKKNKIISVCQFECFSSTNYISIRIVNSISKFQFYIKQQNYQWNKTEESLGQIKNKINLTVKFACKNNKLCFFIKNLMFFNL